MAMKAASAVLALAGLALVGLYLMGSMRYTAMAETAHSDLNAVVETNPNIAGWLTVEGTAIDYPVMRTPEGEPEDFYLSHDVDGKSDSKGVPFLDSRCDADGDHLMVYAHHLGYTNLMFSEICDTYRQSRFAEIGRATFTAADGTVTVFTPLMAMSVDKAYAPIQKFDFEDDGGPASWLTELSGDATARASDMRQRIDGADKALTLVTCTSARAGQRPRTLLVFTSQD